MGRGKRFDAAEKHFMDKERKLRKGFEVEVSLKDKRIQELLNSVQELKEKLELESKTTVLQTKLLRIAAEKYSFTLESLEEELEEYDKRLREMEYAMSLLDSLTQGYPSTSALISNYLLRGHV
jgi:chromosome segregation ATPase